MTNGLESLHASLWVLAICSAQLWQCAAAKLGLPGNRVGLKTTGPPSLPRCFLLVALERSGVLGPNADSLCQIRLTAIIHGQLSLMCNESNGWL